MGTSATSISHDKAMIARLRRDPEFATEYLRAAQEDGDPEVLRIAHRRIVEVMGRIF